MSEFVKTTTKVSPKHVDCLIMALETLFGSGNVEHHKEAQVLKDYVGSGDQNRLAHIIVRRTAVNAYRAGSASNDLGFFVGKESVDLELSKFDRHSMNKDNKFINTVSKLYAENVLEKVCRQKGYVLNKKKVGNKTVIEGTRY